MEMQCGELMYIVRLESGNMVIMALSYAQKTGDISQLKTYVSLMHLRA